MKTNPKMIVFTSWIVILGFAAVGVYFTYSLSVTLASDSGRGMLFAAVLAFIFAAMFAIAETTMRSRQYGSNEMKGRPCISEDLEENTIYEVVEMLKRNDRWSYALLIPVTVNPLTLDKEPCGTSPRCRIWHLNKMPETRFVVAKRDGNEMVLVKHPVKQEPIYIEEVTA